MCTMADIFREGKEIVKQRRAKRNAIYEPLLQSYGAIKKSDGVYDYNGWFLYPTKGYGMLRKNNAIRRPIKYILKRY